MLWIVAMLWGCAPDMYEECLREQELYCSCLDSCLDAEAVETKCTEVAVESNPWSAEDWACYNDTLEETCEEVAAYEACGL